MDNTSPSIWFTALCSVVFDLKVGQRIEHILPRGALSTKEESDVAFHAFPDSMSQELRVCASVRDSCFFFRIKRKRVLYGYVFCRQRQDEKLDRGVDSRAVVIVSPFPFSSVLKPLSAFLGSLYFSEGTEGMEKIYEELLSWTEPQCTRPVQLRVAGHVITATLPPFSILPPPQPLESHQSQRTISGFRNGLPRWGFSDIPETSTALFGEIDVYSQFQNILNRLWSLWELTLTAQPLIVVAPSPVECSSAVSALVSLISPVPYAADFRPYFTIHDPEAATLLQLQDNQEITDWGHNLPTLLGVTNLYFIKSLSFWPNVLSVGERQPVAIDQTKPTFRRFSPKTALQSLKTRAQGIQSLLSHYTENLWSNKKLYTKPEIEVCREMNPKTVTGNPTAYSDCIRKHFFALTTAFLEPFKGYFVPIKASELRNGHGSANLFLEPTGLPDFDPNEFLNSISDWPFPAILRNRFSSIQDLQALYEQFLSSPNFRLWFERQQRLISLDLGLMPQRSEDHELYSQLSVTDSESLPLAEPQRWNCTDEVRLVEEFRRLQSELMDEMQDVSPDRLDSLGTPSQSEREFILVFSAMPDDLRRVLLSSPNQFDFVNRIRRIPDIKDYLHDLPEFII